MTPRTDPKPFNCVDFPHAHACKTDLEKMDHRIADGPKTWSAGRFSARSPVNIVDPLWYGGPEGILRQLKDFHRKREAIQLPVDPAAGTAGTERFGAPEELQNQPPQTVTLKDSGFIKRTQGPQ